MTFDSELESWRDDWRGTDDIPPELRRRVERHIRAGRHRWWPPVTVTVVIGGGMSVWALLTGERSVAQTALAAWLFIAITWATSLLLLRHFGGGRRPAATTTIAYLDFAVRVSRSWRAGIVAGGVLYVLFLTAMLAWRWRIGSVETFADYLLSERVVAMAIVTVAIGLVGWHRYHRFGVELENLLAIQRQFAEGAPLETDR